MRKEELKHWCYVASGFWPWQHKFWLGLLHDTVEDGYLPKALLSLWPALDAITRREGEPYADYIERLSANDTATAVKLRDLQHNLSRNGGPPRESLRARYLKAQSRLGNSHT